MPLIILENDADNFDSWATKIFVSPYKKRKAWCTMHYTIWMTFSVSYLILLYLDL